MKLTHPDAKAPIEVDPKHAEKYLTQGWVDASAKAEKADKPTEPKK